MRRITPVSNLARWLSWLVAVILIILPFHAFLTVWLSSMADHYTLLRLWKEFLLVPIVLGAVYILFKNPGTRRRFLSLWLVRLILVYILLLVICAAVPRAEHAVSSKAMWYGLLVDLRFLIFFLAVLVISSGWDWLASRWRQMLLGPAVIVIAFAILQYLALPYDFLKHFGYGDSTISPYETINHNLQHIRVASTLRGANPLGAYLILPLSALTLAFIRSRRQRLNIAILSAGALAALAFSFSRSAWLGALLAIAVVASFTLNHRAKKIGLYAAVTAVIVVAALAISLRNNLTFQDAFLHTDKASTAAESSNYGHSAALKRAGKDMAHQPLGGGVGTAGPQSFYNGHPARIAENYYLQIGQEAGIIGMVLFIAICVAAGRLLWDRRAEPLALVLLASLTGISLVNLLSHAWSDDTLAYIWWGFAAIALTPVIIEDKAKVKNGQKTKTPQKRSRPVR
jgi:hypothetical protein